MGADINLLLFGLRSHVSGNPNHYPILSLRIEQEGKERDDSHAKKRRTEKRISFTYSIHNQVPVSSLFSVQPSVYLSSIHGKETICVIVVIPVEKASSILPVCFSVFAISFTTPSVHLSFSFPV